MFSRFLTAMLVVALAIALYSCGGDSNSPEPTKGQVTVIITDGPTDQFQRILISMVGMTLIGPGGHVELYNGPEITFDVLEMSEWADLAFTTKVVAGRYNKIRIQLSKVELVDVRNGVSEVLDDLPANGKIDLNPRGPFDVSPDYTTVIKLDIDAKRSFQVVPTGNGKFQLRPIFFVDVYQDQIFLPDRLVRVFGNVRAGSILGTGNADPTDDSFRLCNLQFISQSNGPSLNGVDDCVRIFDDAATSIFDVTGMETDFMSVTDGEPLTAVGFIVDTDDAEAFLGLNAVVLELGLRQSDSTGGWGTIKGNVVDDPATCDTTDKCFDFDPAETDPAVPTRMRPGTRVFRADGVELSQADVGAGDGGSVDALVNGELQTALLVLSNDVDGGIVSGVLNGVSRSDPYDVLEVMTDASGVAHVCANSETDILQVLVQDDAVTIIDLLDPSVLETGSLVEAFGDPAPPPAGCDIVADQIIVEAAP